jgi:hypothetical protein
MICRKCNIDKEFNLMVKHKTERICKECNKVYRKSKYIYKTRPWSILPDYKICRKCNINKHIVDFHKHKGGKCSVDSICKICNRIQSNTIENNHRARQWQIDNRNLVNKRARILSKERSKNDIQYRVKKHIRVRLWELIIKKAKSTRNSKVEDIIGCNILEYRQHLESQFKLEMNWENHGKIWEIDHIKPCDSFDLIDIEQHKQCFHYTNIQPLFKTTEISESFGYINEIGNRNKSNKII